MKTTKTQQKNYTIKTGFGITGRKVMLDNTLSQGARFLYAVLSTYAGQDDSCFPSLETILEDTGYSKSTYYKYLNELVSNNIITIQRRMNQSNIFYLNDREIYVEENATEQVLPKNEEVVLPKISETTNNTITNNNTITKETKETDKKSYVDNYNALISKEVKELIAFYAPTIDKAIEIEKDIFGAKKIATKELLQEGVLKHSDLNDRGVYCIDFSEYGLNLKRLMNNIFMKLRRSRDNKSIKNQKAYFFGSLKKSIKEYITMNKHITENPVPLFNPEELGVV